MPRITLYRVIAILMTTLLATLWPALPLFVPAARAAEALPATQPANPPEDPELEPRIIKLIAQLADPDANVREIADVLLRNQPVYAYPVIERLIATVKDALPAEAVSRLGQYRQMYARLAELDARQRENTRWINRQLLAAYDEAPRRKPAWDADARRTVQFATQWPRSAADDAAMIEVCRRARAAGANDPVFLYSAANIEHHYGRKPALQAMLEILKAASTLMQEGRARVVAQLFRYDAMVMAAGNAGLKNCGEFLVAREASMNFGLGMQKGDVPAELAYDWAWQIQNPATDNLARLTDAAKVQRSLERVIPGSVYVTLFEAVSYRRAAFAATSQIRDDGPRPDPAQVRRDEYLQRSEELFEKAYKMDPQNPMIARERMLRYVETGQAEEAEKWYRLAMAANPDDIITVHERINSLRENPTPFFRELLRQENWRAGMPFLILRWHIANALPYYRGAKAYYAMPHVREVMLAVYTKYLRVYPNDAAKRSQYAKTLMDFEIWPEADRQLRLLDKDWSPRVFVTRSAFEALRDKAARMAAAPPAPNVPAPPEDK